MAKLQSANDVVRCIQSNHRVFVHGAAATPHILLQALLESADRLDNVELIHLHTEGKAAYASPEFRKSFKVVSLFTGANLRHFSNCDEVDYLPCFLSEMPHLFRSGQRPIDVAMLHLSPPDRHGYCTLGTSVDVALAAAQSANILIAQVNHQMPRVHGDGLIHIDEIDYFIEVDEALHEGVSHQFTDEERQIGHNITSLIEDGSCLQVGIGTIPDATLEALRGHKNLGVHSEMWSDGILHLIKCGAVDNSRKTLHKGKTLSGFIQGSKEVYNFINDNSSVIQKGSEYVNNPHLISQNPKAVSINSAVEIDLTGQVCADSIGHNVISGVGGQVDFARGATLSAGGKSFIAMTSRTKKNVSKIVAELKPGAGVVTSRAHVHYIVTEFGVADLAGKTLGERAKMMIELSHPDDREALSKAWHKVRQR